MIHIPAKFIVILGIFWMLTYTVIGAMNYVSYNEMNDYLKTQYNSNDDLTFSQKVNQTLSFRQWLNANFELDEEMLNENLQPTELTNAQRKYWDYFMHDKIKEEQEHQLHAIQQLLHGEEVTVYDVFERFIDGWDWYKNSPALDTVYLGSIELRNPRWQIKNDRYNNWYLAEYGLELTESGNLTKREQGWTEQVWEFLSNIPSGFFKLLDFLTFRITSIDGTEVIPIEARVILNCIFVPINIILLIAISPYVARLVEAIASFLNAIIPF